MDSFITGDSLEAVAGVAADIRHLMAEFPDDDALRGALDRLGCYFSFKLARISPTDWLRAVAERIETAIRTGNAGSPESHSRSQVTPDSTDAEGEAEE